MPLKDPEARRAYNRDYQRKWRGKRRGDSLAEKNSETIPVSLAPVVLRDAEGAISILEEQINLVRATDTDTLSRARCIGYLVGVFFKALDVSKYALQEERIAALERINTEKQIAMIG